MSSDSNNPNTKKKASKKKASKKKASKKKASKKKKPKKKTSKKKKPRVGEKFELRAKEAFEFIRPERLVTHDEKVEAIYGRRRQLDVTERVDGELERAHEAKDYGDPVPIEKIDAFETKLRELKTPPTHGCSIVSASGFQAAPIARAQHYRDHPNPAVRVVDLYQLRGVDEADFEGRIREFQLEFQARGVVPETVRLRTIASEGPSEQHTFRAERAASFVFDEKGQIVDNILDRINALVMGHRVEEPAEHSVEFQQRVWCQLGDKKVEIAGFDVTLVPSEIESRVGMDLGSGARDVLVDCVGDERWIIPDPKKALSASRKGHSLRIAFDEASKANMAALEVPAGLAQVSPDAQLVNAIQLQVALGLLKAMRGDEHEAPPGLVDDLDKAAQAFTEGRLDVAKKLYWRTCSEIGSSLPALVNLTDIHLEEGDLDRALYLAARTVELFPFEAHGFVNYVVVSLRRGELKRARDGLEASKLLHAGSPSLIRAEAQLLFAEGQPLEAAKRFMELYYRGVESAETRYLAARCAARAGHIAQAIWDTEQALAHGELPTEAYVFLARLLEKSQQYERLRDFGLQLLDGASLQPRDRGVVRVSVAGACYELGDIEASARLMAEVETEAPGRYFVSGLLALSRNEFARAVVEFEASLVHDPGITAARWNLALAHLHDGSVQKALLAVEQCTVDDAPSRQEYWRCRCVVHASCGDSDRANEAGEEAIEAGADAPTLWIEASDAALAADQWGVWSRLRPRCLDHKSDVPGVCLEQALLLLDQLDGSEPLAATVRDRLAVARPSVGHTSKFAFAELLLLIRTRDDSLEAVWAATDPSQLENEPRMLLAAEAQREGRFELALRMLDGSEGIGTASAIASRLPSRLAIRSAAYLGLGRIDDARAALDQLSDGELEHPFTRTMMAYRRFADGDLAAAAALLHEILGQRPDHGESLQLQLAIWVEQGRYRDAYELILRLVPSTAHAEDAAWWSLEGTREPGTVAVPEGIGAMAGGAAYIVAMGRPGARAHVAVPTDYWETGFKFGKQFDGCLPTLVRMREPVETIRLLRQVATRPRH